MAIFEDIKLSFKGDDYTIPANRVLKTICKLEKEISLAELMEGNVKPGQLATLFNMILMDAGSEDKSDEIYSTFFASKDSAKNAGNATTALLLMMIPPEHLKSDFKPKKKTAVKPRTKKA